MPSTTIQYFEFKHLPAHLQAVSEPIHNLAHLMEHVLPDGPEKSAGMRKLLEAKDCFVRAALGVEAKPQSRRRRFLCPRCDCFVEAELDAEGETTCPKCENTVRP
jgi:hypothetical protein